MGGQVLDKKPGSKEGFFVGVETPAEDPQAGNFCIGPNFWPGGLSTEEDDVFDGLMTDPVANIKLLHYPPNPAQSPEDAPVGAGTHTDFGTITILVQQPGHPGLEALHPSTKTWIQIPAQEDVLVVNLGDLLQKRTKGVFKSPVHRAISASQHHPYSVPFFYHGNLDTRLSPVDGSGEGMEETSG
ncbi:hypothetical protein BKA65DRAFT_555472 [Rhexocercosporidium sp. MPI-PUGE-AT-0058]|nr:hypothetical protein BKA65DRAFT_555472 [Rhexocercosporidium sp. MPI-PUGE-AT-0058]